MFNDIKTGFWIIPFRRASLINTLKSLENVNYPMLMVSGDIDNVVFPKSNHFLFEDKFKNNEKLVWTNSILYNSLINPSTKSLWLISPIVLYIGKLDSKLDFIVSNISI